MSKNFCFTINNYTDDHVSYLRELFARETVVYATFGYETAPQTGTQHIQGYVHFAGLKRSTVVRPLIQGEFGNGHISPCRGTPLQNKTYCQKDGNIEEFGTFENVSTQGQRNDFQGLKEFIVSSPDWPSDAVIAEQFTSLWMRYGRRCKELRDLLRVPAALEVGPYKPGWQTVLKDRLMAPPNDRKIYFVVDEQGNQGKSWFCRKFLSDNEKETQLLSIGKRDDLAYAIDETKKFFLFDIPRGNMRYLQYGVLESLKNRIIFSSKYVSTTKRLLMVPHVVVFCNEDPDREALTRDRYNIMNIRVL